ncbi:hypothetical protein IFM89_021391 [Coptis chinensis]|uniref:Uncharacterized protein n=1 Tax=Coptis chinensis TaxID=261450 RepID=A0A835ICE4_9MAGN|nr:hypothetical protein IFM89_021391 [Coptis chinensis]
MNYRNAKLRWSLGCLRIGIIGIMLLGQVTKGQFEVPAQGLLCISECTSCPVICSPPPSQSSPAPPTPSSPSYSPPVIYYKSPSPPSTHNHQPPPPPPLSPPPSSSSSESSPPPPSPNYQTIPSVSTPPLPTASMRADVGAPETAPQQSYTFTHFQPWILRSAVPAGGKQWQSGLAARTKDIT